MLMLSLALKTKPLTKYLREDYAAQKKRSLRMSSLGLVAHSIVGGWRPRRPAGEHAVVDSLWHLIELCLDGFYEERPTMENIVEHIREVIKEDVKTGNATGAAAGAKKDTRGLLSRETGTQKKTGAIFSSGKALALKFSDDKDKKVLASILSLINPEDQEQLAEIVRDYQA
jgi:hypothetical protein